MIDPHSIKAAIRKVKDLQYTDIEIKVRDATNNDPWGTKSTLMQEIADATHNYEDYPRLFSMLWKRLTDLNHVMHVHKALLLIEYLLRNGADRFIRDAKQRSKDIQRLKRYKHYDQNSEDDAKDARIKAKKVYDLLTDDKLLQEERAKAEKLKSKKITGMSSRSAHTSTHTHHSSGLQPSVEDRYGSITPAEMGMEEPQVPAEKAAPGEVDPLDEEDDGKDKGDDDPFGAPAQMTGGEDEDRPAPKKKGPKAEKAGQQTVDAEPEKKKKKHKKKTKSTASTTTPSESQDDDPFADTEVPKMTTQTSEPVKQTKKATIMSAFDDEGDSRSGEVDLLTSAFSAPSKQPASQDWAFGDGASKSKEKAKTDAWDFDGDKSKTSEKAKDDDPWAMADVSLGSKTAKPTTQTTGKTMAAMRGTAPPKTIEFTSNPWADSPFGAPTTQQQTKTIPQTYQVGFPPTGGYPSGGYPTSGGYPPSGGYQQYPPTGGYYGGYPTGPSGGFGQPTPQQNPFGAFAPPPTTTSTAYDPFASLSIGGPQPVSVTGSSSTSTSQKKTTTAFDGLGW